MECYLGIGVWCIVGVWCIINNWRNSLDVELGQIIPLIFCGVTIGPFIGILDLTIKLGDYIWPRKFRPRVLIKRKNI